MYNLEQMTLPFIFKREVKTIDPIMQNNFLVLIKKKKKKDCIKRCFISLRSPSSVKRKMTEVTVKCLCAKFGLKNFSGMHCPYLSYSVLEGSRGKILSKQLVVKLLLCLVIMSMIN